MHGQIAYQDRRRQRRHYEVRHFYRIDRLRRRHVALRVQTEPALEPLTREQIKEHCRITETEEHPLIDAWITAARQRCEQFTNRTLITTSWRLTLDAFPAVVHLPRPPIQSPLTSVKYYDGSGVQQTLAAANYQLDAESEPGRLVPAYGLTWPTTRSMLNAVEVIYKAGYGLTRATVPALLLVGMKMLVAHWYEHREQFTPEQMNEVPEAVQAIFWQFRILEAT
ncbi:MAG: head-tail connector protein [Planctomycetota bacterium]